MLIEATLLLIKRLPSQFTAFLWSPYFRVWGTKLHYRLYFEPNSVANIIKFRQKLFDP